MPYSFIWPICFLYENWNIYKFLFTISVLPFQFHPLSLSFPSLMPQPTALIKHSFHYGESHKENLAFFSKFSLTVEYSVSIQVLPSIAPYLYYLKILSAHFCPEEAFTKPQANHESWPYFLLHLASPKCSPEVWAGGLLWHWLHRVLFLATVDHLWWLLVWPYSCERRGLKPGSFLLATLTFQPPQNETPGPGEGISRTELQSRKED